MVDKTAFTTGPGRKPDYIIRAKPKARTELGGQVGAAWINDDKSITIKLQTCTILLGNDDLMIRMFPADKTSKPPVQKQLARFEPGSGYDPDEDQPF